MRSRGVCLGHFCFCEGFRMPARDDGAAHAGAGVRKPAGKEPARGVRRRCRGRYGDLAVAAWVAVMGSGLGAADHGCR